MRDIDWRHGAKLDAARPRLLADLCSAARQHAGGAIVLREIDGLSYDEIAFSLGIAIGTVKSRLTRARDYA